MKFDCRALWILSALMVFAASALAEVRPGCDAELGLSRMEPLVQVRGYAGAGRMQIFPQNSSERTVLRLGKRAVPLLIECLTDETKSQQAVFDLWPETTVGDIAFSFLVDLFTDTKEHTTIDRIPTYRDVRKESPVDSTEWDAWNAYIAKHGRKSIQRIWLDQWDAISGRVYWDKKERCFQMRTAGARRREKAG